MIGACHESPIAEKTKRPQADFIVPSCPGRQFLSGSGHMFVLVYAAPKCRDQRQRCAVPIQGRQRKDSDRIFLSGLRRAALRHERADAGDVWDQRSLPRGHIRRSAADHRLRETAAGLGPSGRRRTLLPRHAADAVAPKEIPGKGAPFLISRPIAIERSA
jgi:hypothetical protein